MTNWDAAMARRLRKQGTSWDKIGQVFGVTGDTVRIRLDPEYAERRRNRNNARRRDVSERNSVLDCKERRLKEWRESSAAKKASGFRYNEGARAHQADEGWQSQIALMPRDTRSITATVLGDPVPGDPRCPWRPSSRQSEA